MALPPQKFREIVFQLLYSQDFSEVLDEDMTPFMMQQLTVSKRVVREALALQTQIKEKFKEIDPLITEASVEYAFDRIPKVERTILRLGIFELLFSTTVPGKVAIAEAIRLARKFATPSGGTFINAILDFIYKKYVKEGASNEDLLSVSRG